MIINKVTKLFPLGNNVISEELIQSHMDEQNADGWYLVSVDNLKGWYRFFWAKVIDA